MRSTPATTLVIGGLISSANRYSAAAFSGYNNPSSSLSSPRTDASFLRALIPGTASRSGGARMLAAARNDDDNNPLGAILDIANNLFPSPIGGTIGTTTSKEGEEVVRSFIDALNSRNDPPSVIASRFFDDDIEYVDTSYYNPIRGVEALSRHYYLHAVSSPLSTFAADSSDVIVVDDIVSSATTTSSSYGGDDGTSKVCVMYHLASSTGGRDIDDTTAISFYNLRGGKITRVFDVTEPSSPKPGDAGLRLLKSVSNLIGDESIVMATSGGSEDDSDGRKDDPSISAVERYFDAWNRRDMKDAVSLFAEDCVMRDLQYDDAFHGRDEFEKHLLRVKDCLPSAFNFVVDDIAASSSKAGVMWHVENDGDPLAFTRGCSFYVIDERTGLIRSGFEIPEKAPPKTGYLASIASKFESEPARVIPAVMWAAYMYVLFFSDGILPGANALAFEQRTWEEVRDLSLNFFLVAPSLGLPFSPVVHPMLEGVFNLLLAWAAMFAGFLSDERDDKPNLLPFGPMLVGMQFLTSGFLLPYLFTRTPETSSEVYREDITGDIQSLVGEWRPLGGFLGGVGLASVFWGIFARPEFGGLSERYGSFVDLLSIDRVGSSFIVDLAIFAAFQGWFVDDDLKRRGISDDADEFVIMRNVAKYFPFFGLVAYLTARPPLPTRESSEP
mmetsp:Transcript_30024/g.72498  ORF Transcript_30024/g.72498 Transcript_30024/m.72498 type:complete len:670 (-) Transcript_30024:188-2197(-)